MPKQDIIAKIKEVNLLGRSGSGFPTALKWGAIKKARAKKKYIICNGSEGEPNVFKDRFILENYPEKLVKGLKIALKTIDNSSAYIYLNKDYYEKFKPKLEKLTKGLAVVFFKKPAGYISGEETTILNVIEGKLTEPRIKPPYPAESGLFGFPTLINNVETFYRIAQIAENEYKNNRFYCISGDVKNKGIYDLPENRTIKRILEETDNSPDFDFFVQAGGGAMGEILLPKELNKQVQGIGSIIVYNRKKTNLFSLMEKWINFLSRNNCDKCVPCREGLYRIRKILESKKIDKKNLEDVFFVLEETSFCALGKGAVVPFKTLMAKLLK